MPALFTTYSPYLPPATLWFCRSSQITIIFVLRTSSPSICFSSTGLFNVFTLLLILCFCTTIFFFSSFLHLYYPLKQMVFILCLVLGSLKRVHVQQISVFGFIETKVLFPRHPYSKPVVFLIHSILLRLNDIFHFGEHFTKRKQKLSIVLLHHSTLFAAIK